MSHYKLTPAQQAIWIGQKLHPTEPLYNMVMLFTIHGQLDVEAFKRAFEQLVHESEALRLVFTEIDGEVFQGVNKERSKPLEYVTVQEEDFSIDHWATVRGRQQLDLSNSNYDTALIKHGEATYTWFINQHHIVTDLSSFRALFVRLSELYWNNEVEAFPLPSYLTFLDEQAKAGDEVPVIHTVNKEQQELVGPFGKTLPNFFSSKSTRTIVPLYADLIKRLNSLFDNDEYKILNKNLTQLVFFYSLFEVLLNKINGRQTFVGLPTHNRFSMQRKRLPGLVMSVFPMQPADMSGLTFREHFHRNKNRLFNYLVQSQRGNGPESELTQVEALLNYLPIDFNSFGELQCDTKWLHIGFHDAQHYIRLHLQTNASDNLEILFDFNDAIFTPANQQQTVNAFQRLVEDVVNDDTGLISDWSFFSDNEKTAVEIQTQLILNEQTPSVSIVTWFGNTVSVSPNVVALSDGNNQMTYAQLDEYSSRLANHLTKNGLKSQQRVGVMTNSAFQFPQIVLALLKCNAVLVPLDVSYPEKRISYMLEQSRCQFLLTNFAVAESFKDKVDCVIDVAASSNEIESCSNRFEAIVASANDLIYLLFTSGTSGRPKGVQVSHSNIGSYLSWAQQLYRVAGSKSFSAAFFTSVGFDLTYTSLFLPLISGGTVFVFDRFSEDPVGSLARMFSTDAINLVKLTPAHISLLMGTEIGVQTLKTVIVGGEQLTTSAVSLLKTKIHKSSGIFNEYGPTEATIGCIIHKVNGGENGAAVPIGKVAPGMTALVLNEEMVEVTTGVAGELYLKGMQVALGYENDQHQTSEKFIKIDKNSDNTYYRTGDIVRINQNGDFEYIGRKDGQLKIGSRRVEKEEIEHVLSQFNGIKSCTVWPKALIDKSKRHPKDIRHCTICGLPDNYPGIHFNSKGICGLCEKYEEYKQRSADYFKSKDELFNVLKNAQAPEYDCIVLLSGGKDSSFALAKLADQNLRILAFTLDNGFLSREAMENIDRVVKHVGVDHMWARTPAMKEVFVDSLHRYANVCDGCFKVIYTMAIQVALEKKIPYIVTGLSRGQFFETRLTEELFLNPDIDPKKIDEHILNARKAYHKVEDAVKRLVATQELFNNDTFKKVQFLDFYRFYDVSYDEMIRFLTAELPWLRPQDTGRSTNCLINDLGIYVHKKFRGYHNYALPYSWDVRLGHKTREQAIKEFDDQLEEAKILQMAHQIGYDELAGNDDILVGFYSAESAVDENELREYLQTVLPAFMVPSQLVELPELPLTSHGKIDQERLGQYLNNRQNNTSNYVLPRNDIEEYLAQLWATFLNVERVSVFDNFIALGGHSLVAIRIISRLEKELGIKVPLVEVFEKPSVAAMAGYLEQVMEEGLNEA